jgi:hypothetical protein
MCPCPCWSPFAPCCRSTPAYAGLRLTAPTQVHARAVQPPALQSHTRAATYSAGAPELRQCPPWLAGRHSSAHTVPVAYQCHVCAVAYQCHVCVGSCRRAETLCANAASCTGSDADCPAISYKDAVCRWVALGWPEACCVCIMTPGRIVAATHACCCPLSMPSPGRTQACDGLHPGCAVLHQQCWRVPRN